ncbi:hypothetical protein OESDEN_13111 [Oesophagostomum dentatum]|uniref:Uncharacterized protein n=1 Tax=Oesophagostomum dentatum TaxID=61180 RepID=A0A0B1SP98_OESDE|nr:hypothetical protein OESDEN_13111 [Oesophagostomum dentatum]
MSQCQTSPKSACPKSFIDQYLAIIIVAVVVPVVIILAAALFIVRWRKQEEERLNALWQIPFIMLAKPNAKVSNMGISAYFSDAKI